MPVAILPSLESSQALGRLEAWLDTVRGPLGYTGPVAHWWDSCLVYTGVMLDWRYEGILCGYLNLYHRTQDERWLAKACRAGDDLVRGQLPNGHFWSSSFEHGPKPGGTPHEAAADIGLLELATILKEKGRPAWQVYFATAERNLQRLIQVLWNGHGFQDQPDNPVLVANKNATLLEALLLYQNISGVEMMRYIEAALRVILSAQVKEGWRTGATVHRGTFRRQISFGLYTARCLGALTRLMAFDCRPESLDFAALAVRYLLDLIPPSGTYIPLGHYGSGWLSRQMPTGWVSPNGELLRALWQASQWVEVPPKIIERLYQLCVQSILPSGSAPTAWNLGMRGQHARPDFRDVLPVTGWCDKLFRALTLLTAPTTPSSLEPATTLCQWRGRKTILLEDALSLTLQEESGQVLYFWQKGAPYPSIIELWP